ncbi:uncharacterized protein LOC142775150 [Rhipicephalus microplus]|uniref:uncharacterized protein LOC142775150 n=1 Tax=Rhipicephalus microplus TaxID=6941 RepID=UPI003F6C982A
MIGNHEEVRQVEGEKERTVVIPLSNALRWSGVLVAVCVLANRRIFNGGHAWHRVRSDARIKEYSWSGGHGQRGPVNDLFASATPKIICSHVKEKAEMSSLFVHEEDERVPLTSCVVYPGPSLEQAYFLNFHMDNRKIFRLIPVKGSYRPTSAKGGCSDSSERSSDFFCYRNGSEIS